jgi:hypothetical protein
MKMHLSKNLKVTLFIKTSGDSGRGGIGAGASPFTNCLSATCPSLLSSMCRFLIRELRLRDESARSLYALRLARTLSALRIQGFLMQHG